jgi:hypothetical protein
MESYEELNLGQRPSDATPGRVSRVAAGPGCLITFEQAVQLAEKAMSDADMAVLAVQELDFGWVMVLQGRKYLATRAFSDQLVGHGVTIVDRKTGDVFCSRSATKAWDAIAGYLETRVSPAG